MITHDKIERLLDRMEREGVTPIDWPEYYEARAAIEADRQHKGESVKMPSDAEAALRFAARVIELYDDATMDGYIIDSGDCVEILNALADYFSRFGQSVQPITEFEDPRVQTVYRIICGGHEPPEGEHWDGYISRLIVDALQSQDREAVLQRRGKPVMYQMRTRPAWGEHWSRWVECTREQAEVYRKTPFMHDLHYEVRELYTAPPSAGPVKRKRRYAEGAALGEFGIIPMCDQVDETAKASIMTDHAEPLICTFGGYQYLLGPEYVGELDWYDANRWCKSLGEDYELPNRLVMLAISTNVRTAALLDKYSYYWTSSEVEDDGSSAWVQLWDSKFQSFASKSFAYKVRAVRRRRIE